MKKFISLISILSLFFNYSYGQLKNSFELIEVKSDKIYYNLIQYEGKLYIGTSEGVIIVDSKGNSETLDKSIKGYLNVEKGKIIGNSITFGHIIKEDENAYNYLLPDAFKDLISRYDIYNNKLYIINSGKLFVYKENYYTISHDSLSVRSITQNYIGSYKGIFKNGIKLKFPEYTDGVIREYPNETFICYEGLYRDSSGITHTYANSNKEVVIQGQNLGSARDIQYINNNNYVLATNKGIFIINFILNKVTKIIISNSRDESFTVFKIDQSDKNSTRVFFSAFNKLYYYVIETNEKVLILDTKSEKNIKQAFFPNTIDKIYILFENKFSLFSLSNTKYIEDILLNNLVFCHNFKLFKEKIYISTNIGLHIYDIKKNKPYLNVIPLEINNRSLCVINDTIKFGTINGIVNISNENVEKLIATAEKNNTLNTEKNTNPTILYLFLGLIFTILLLIFFIIRLKKSLKESKDAFKKKSELNESYGEATKENINYYIQENITTVTIQSIRDQFDLTPAALYEILGNDKPGEIIRNHRMELVRKYRRLKLSEDEISQKTGFSVSYLKKIY